MNSKQLEFEVTLFRNKDGTFSAHGKNLQGLFLETESLVEMKEELLRLTPRLLRSNHGLSDDEIKKVKINVVNDDHNSLSKSLDCAPRLMWENNLPAQAVV
ncbi:MAG: hypothetical protein OXE94_07895 [Aestuariivita sp.]|nr:hypothetical protein [Aestuariivita sp.]MCY4204014.1 hypothetical protein [Aestuariivita sp.]MCY4289745.1 hypothetical protein [Aestuariivita sp.]MCY4347624.1 hypothetical protein [Aestuariivita sp.]